MGLLDIFGKGGGAMKKHAARMSNKRAQTQDRWESIRFLHKERTREAVEALLPRFGYKVDPRITDREEKEAVVEAIVAAGAEEALGAVTEYLASAESIAWPMKVINRLMDTEGAVGQLVGLLAAMDVDYERFPEKKIQVLADLEERSDPRIAAAVAPFLRDMNETARYHAAGALLHQAERDGHMDALVDAFVAEEGIRVRSFVVETMASEGLSFGERKGEVADLMPSGFKLDKGGVPVRL